MEGHRAWLILEPVHTVFGLKLGDQHLLLHLINLQYQMKMNVMTKTTIHLLIFIRRLWAIIRSRTTHSTTLGNIIPRLWAIIRSRTTHSTTLGNIIPRLWAIIRSRTTYSTTLGNIIPRIVNRTCQLHTPVSCMAQAMHILTPRHSHLLRKDQQCHTDHRKIQKFSGYRQS